MHAVPLEIYRQLGANRFLAMTGAKDLVGSTDALGFKLPGTMTKGRGNWFRVTLAADDTYTLEYHRTRGLKSVPLATHKGVNVSDLRRLFTDMTGLDTSL